jgi:hypothetical protein
MIGSICGGLRHEDHLPSVRFAFVWKTRTLSCLTALMRTEVEVIPADEGLAGIGEMESPAPIIRGIVRGP